MGFDEDIPFRAERQAILNISVTYGVGTQAQTVFKGLF